MDGSPAHGATVAAVHQEDGSEGPRHPQVGRLPDQNHDGFNELDEQHVRLATADRIRRRGRKYMKHTSCQHIKSFTE